MLCVYTTMIKKPDLGDFFPGYDSRTSKICPDVAENNLEKV